MSDDVKTTVEEKASTRKNADALPLKSVYFGNPPRAFEGTQTMAWATIEAGTTYGAKCTSITLIGGHTVKIVKGGKVRLVPWLSCKDAEAL